MQTTDAGRKWMNGGQILATAAIAGVAVGGYILASGVEVGSLGLGTPVAGGIAAATTALIGTILNNSFGGGGDGGT